MQVETLFFIAKLLFWGFILVGANWPATDTYTEPSVGIRIKVGDLVRSLYTEPRLWGVVVEFDGGRTIRVLLDDGRLVKCTSNQVEVVS